MTLRHVAVAVALAAACGNDIEISPGARARADVLWTERCSNCHGVEGRGEGPNARTLLVSPRDFTDESWQLSASDEHIARIIVGGGTAVGKSDQMTANPDLAAAPDVVRALVAKVRSFRP